MNEMLPLSDDRGLPGDDCAYEQARPGAYLTDTWVSNPYGANPICNARQPIIRGHRPALSWPTANTRKFTGTCLRIAFKRYNTSSMELQVTACRAD